MRKIFTIACFLFIASFQICISQWKKLQLIDNNIDFRTIAVDANNIFVGTLFGIYFSSDQGNTWTAKNSGLNNLSVRAIAINDSNIFAGTDGGIYHSTDNGNNWIQNSNGLIDKHINNLAIKNNIIVATDFDEGIYLSNDYSNNWVFKNLGFTKTYVITVGFKGNSIFVGTSKGIFLSTDYGNNWVDKNNELTKTHVNSISVSGNNIYAGTMISGIVQSVDNGDNWIEKNNGLTYSYIYSIFINGNNIFAGAAGGIFVSKNDGLSWTDISFNLGSSTFSSIAICGDYIFVVLTSSGAGNLFRAKLSDLITDITDKAKPNNSLSISPNPATNTVTLNYPENIMGEQIRIYNTMGIPVWSGIADDDRKAIDVSQFPCGAYFIRIGDKTRIFVKE